MFLKLSELQDPKFWDNKGYKIIVCPRCNKAGCEQCQNLGFIRIKTPK